MNLTFNDSSSSLPPPSKEKGACLPNLKVREVVKTRTTVPLNVFSYLAIPHRGHMRCIQTRPPIG